MCGVGNRKNEDFLKALAEVGVDPYRSTLDLIDELHAAGVGVALITSSRNASAVLGSADVDPDDLRSGGGRQRVGPTRSPRQARAGDLPRGGITVGRGTSRQPSWSRMRCPGSRRARPVVSVASSASTGEATGKAWRRPGADVVVEDLRRGQRRMIGPPHSVGAISIRITTMWGRILATFSLVTSSFFSPYALASMGRLLR